MTKLTPSERLTRSIEYDLEHDREIISGFVTSLASDPLYHLSWGDKVLRAAARIQIREDVQEELKANTPLDHIHKTMTAQLIMMSRSVPSSSSTMDNLCKHHERAAYAEMIETLARYIEA